MNSITITMPLPPPALSPNARVHWAKKSNTVKAARYLARIESVITLNRRRPPGWEKAETKAVFYFKEERRRDADNLAASLKSYMDGIADAGIVLNDSGLRHAPPEMRIDKARPRVELTVTEVLTETPADLSNPI